MNDELDKKPKRNANLPVKTVKAGLPAVSPRALPPTRQDPLDLFMREVNRIPLLTREEEEELARRFVAGDAAAARRLVESNLRFVVKIAHSYSSYNVKLVDLIQEGNIGLMKAVQKFNPDRGYRLISYAVWWIKAYMQNYIIRSWSLVKVGTSQAQRRLFFKNGGQDEAQKLEELTALAQEAEGQDEVVILPAAKKRAGGAEAMSAYRDFSLDSEASEDGKTHFVDLLVDPGANQEQDLAREQILARVSQRLPGLIEQLNPKEKELLELRILADDPETLAVIGERWGVSRERVRQLEAALKKKLAGMLGDIDSIEDLG
jgi:RNA polymerase sigma-32 factor